MREQVDERRSTPDRRCADRRRAALPQFLAERRVCRGVGGRRRTDRQRRGLVAVRTVRHSSVPLLLTVDEVAEALRTTRKAVYALIDRGHLPGVVRVRRRILVRQSVLLQWLQEKGAPSLRETER